MKDIAEVLRKFKLDAIYGVDEETYYEKDTGYSLRNKTLGTTEYVTDPRFKTHCVSVMRHDDRRPKVLTAQQYACWLPTVNWKRCGFLAHHTQFDGYIASHHHGIVAKAYFCTMSMAQPLMPVQVGTSLDKVDKALGGSGKVGTEALVEMMGVSEPTKAQLRELMKYAGNDIEREWNIFKKMLPFIPYEEMRLIDITIKMYVRPTLLLNEQGLRDVRAQNIANKLAAVKKCGMTPEGIRQDEVFADKLRSLGIDPPTKISAKKTITARKKNPNAPDVINFAFAKGDQEFVDLAAHEKKKVRELVAARLAIKSNQLEKRCDRLISRVPLGPTPVYLRYCAARTTRWGGGDLANWQNLSSKRKEGGAELRAAIMAPPGHILLIADLSQIEARFTAWDSGQEDKLEVFRAFDHIIGYKEGKHGPEPIRSGPDVYRYTAGKIIYNKPLDQITDLERFMGKTCELALGYQAGWPRFARTLRLGQMGPPMDISDRLAKDVHSAWRSGNARIVQNWRTSQSLLTSAFIGQQILAHGVVSYEGKSNNVGFMHLPGGLNIRYDDLQVDGENKLSYLSKYQVGKKGGVHKERTGLYGGIILQNKIEGLARRAIGDHMLELADANPQARIVMSTHDEIVMCAPIKYGSRMLSSAKSIMSKPPEWARDLPIAVDAHLSARYDK